MFTYSYEIMLLNSYTPTFQEFSNSVQVFE